MAFFSNARKKYAMYFSLSVALGAAVGTLGYFASSRGHDNSFGKATSKFMGRYPYSRTSNNAYPRYYPQSSYDYYPRRDRGGYGYQGGYSGYQGGYEYPRRDSGYSGYQGGYGYPRRERVYQGRGISGYQGWYGRQNSMYSGYPQSNDYYGRQWDYSMSPGGYGSYPESYGYNARPSDRTISGDWIYSGDRLRYQTSNYHHDYQGGAWDDDTTYDD